jgi:hypothetical protein
MIIERLGAVGQLELHLHLLILFVGILSIHVNPSARTNYLHH